MKTVGWMTCALFVTSAFPLYAAKQPTVNRGHWKTVQLPFRPYSITLAGGAFWLCGLDETIAVSTDQGATWQIEHQQRDGEVLLDIEFVDKLTAHAAGTGGLILSTIDGGVTWSSHKSGATLGQFSFADATHGIAEIDGRIDLTADGGATWQPVTVAQTDPRVQPFSQVESLAALSPTHFAAALHKDQGENIVLSTIDGGETWVPTHIVNTFASRLLTRDGEYWAFGIEYLGREHDPSGGYSAPVTLRSRDGRTWEHGIRASTEFDGCTTQACYLRYGVLEDLYGTNEKIWSLPQDSPLGEHWAMVSDMVCTVDESLKCGQAIPSFAPQRMPDTGSRSISIPERKKVSRTCLQCALSEVPAPESLHGRGAMIKGVALDFTVNRNGSVSEVHVTGAPSKTIDKGLTLQARAWLFEPAHDGLNTIAAKRRVELNLLCYPPFPGQTDPPSCDVISADSMNRRIGR